MAGVGLFLSAEAHAKTVKVEMTAVETEVVVDGEGTKYSAWTFNNQFPGPVIRVKQGDQVDFTLTNPSSNTRPHSMDFHAAKASFLTHYKELNPGESSLHLGGQAARHLCLSLRSVSDDSARCPWHGRRDHCRSQRSERMPKADREYVLVQTELYKDPDDVQAMFDRRYENVVFNGGVFRYDPVHAKSGGNFLEAKPGERVRFFFINAGPNNFSAVHPIAEIWDECGIAVIRPIA